jgi:hypothetical protein
MNSKYRNGTSSDMLVYSGDCIMNSHLHFNGSTAAEICIFVRRTTKHAFDIPHKIQTQPAQGMEASAVKIILTNILHSTAECIASG